MIGQTLDGYRIVEQIGMGGMATVFKAYDPSMDRYVAIKILPDRYAQDPSFLHRFEREAKAIAQLEHPSILPVYAFGEDGGVTYLVMRYLPTGTLKDRIARGSMHLDEVQHILTQVAGALDYAHEQGILHRDVKPANVLLDDRNNAYLTDFGLAKIVEASIDLTGDRMLGTPAYMSPEQCKGDEELTAATDQYSLGIMAYEMLTERTPFQAETPIAVVHKQLFDPLPPPRSLRPDLPERVEQVLLKALSKEPSQRFESCGRFTEAFSAALPWHAPGTEYDATTQQIPAAQTDPTVQAVSAGKAGRAFPVWGYAIIGLVILAGLIGGGAALGMFGGSEPESSEPAPGAAAAVDDPTHTPQPTATTEPAIEPTDMPAPTAALRPTSTPQPTVDVTLFGCQPEDQLLYQEDFEAIDSVGLWPVEAGPDGRRALHATRRGDMRFIDTPVTESRIALWVWQSPDNVWKLWFREQSDHSALTLDVNRHSQWMAITTPDAAFTLSSSAPMLTDRWVLYELIWEAPQTLVIYNDGVEVLRTELTVDESFWPGTMMLEVIEVSGGLWIDDLVVCGP